MQTFDVPCERCDEFRQRFERAGFQVHGCDPAGGGMCTLRFEPADAQPGPAAGGAAALPAAAAAGAGGASGVGVAATAAAAAAPAAPSATPMLTPTQAATAKAIVNIFETSQVLGDYGKVTALADDPGRLTYGRSQTSLASGNLAKLLQQYCANPGARFAGRLRPLLPRFEAQAAELDTDLRLHNLLRACADDPVMRETQDRFFDEAYWAPALRTARQAGIVSPLGVAVVYDSRVHGSWGTCRDLTNSAAGSLAAIGERAWVSAYVARRRQWLAASSNALLRSSVYRMDAFRRLIDQGFWGLPLPLVVRDLEVSSATLSALPRGCYDGPHPGTRPLALAQPLPRGLDVRLVQLALSDRGMTILADGVFGQTTKNRIGEFQVAQGRPVTGVADVALIAELVG